MEQKKYKFYACQYMKEDDPLFKHILEDKTLYITDEEGKSIKIEGKEQLTELIRMLGCKVVAI